MVRSRSYIATPPGATIKEQLIDRGMSQKEFAIRMDMSEKHISKLINGEVLLTSETAIRLETVLGVPAKFWNNLEAIYREKIIKANMENEMDADIETAKLFPYSEMVKLGWISDTRDSKERVLNLRSYFGIVNLSLLENSRINNIACRRLAITEKSDLALMAWAQEAKIMAREVDTEPINVKGLLSLVPEIRNMTIMNPKDFCPMLKEHLASCGVALVFLPHLKGSFLHGASFINGNKIVLGLTTRGRDADKFWFSLFHELGHIVLGHVGKIGGTTDQDEHNADIWARDILISEEDYHVYVEENNFSENSVLKFAEKVGIAPGIIVGRLQSEGIIEYNRMNNLKNKYEIVI